MKSKTKLVAVTQDHIDEGIRNHCERCPVALALSEAFPESVATVVDENKLKVLGADGEAVYPIVYQYAPVRVRRFVSKFDRGVKVEPLRFRVDVRDDNDNRWLLTQRGAKNDN